jgi:exopolyphosphatase / guanosine-5'-triphosphate,3'-diphosphate pyrophosphatase
MTAIIDMGSNTMRLSIYQMNQGLPELVLSKKQMVGLASYVDGDNIMSEEGMIKALETLLEFKKVLSNLNIRKRYVIATAAIRNAQNSEAIIQFLRRKSKMTIELISGEEEAIFDLKGVLLMDQFERGIVLDIGGASTEVVFYENQQVKVAYSIPLGSLNAYMKYVKELIPTKKEQKTIKEEVLSLIPSHEDIPQGVTMYGVGGTMRGTLKLSKQLFDDVTDNKITYQHVKDIIKFTSENKSDIVPILQTIPDRIHTIVPGMVIAKTLMKHYESELVVINHFGLREGYVYQKAMDQKLKRQGLRSV